MSLLERTPVEPSDAELIARVRGGDTAAYGDLFGRHQEAANRLARSLVRGSDADDLVSEAFTKLFNVLLNGGGPDLAFRAYLLTALRRLHVDRVRATRRTTPTDDVDALDQGVAFEDTAIAGFEGGAAARAFRSLPERWQLVLWHLEVEGQKPAEIAPLLAMSPNSVSALAYRAREGLRQAFLQMHAADVGDDSCTWTRGKLGAYVRHGLSRRESEKVEQHLQGCRPCTAVYLELTEVNSSLAAVLGPLVLGSAALVYLGGGSTPGVLATLGGLVSRGVDVVTTHSQAAVVAGTTAAVAAAGITGVVVFGDDPATPPSDRVGASAPTDTSARAPQRSTDRPAMPSAREVTDDPPEQRAEEAPTTGPRVPDGPARATEPPAPAPKVRPQRPARIDAPGARPLPAQQAAQARSADVRLSLHVSGLRVRQQDKGPSEIQLLFTVRVAGIPAGRSSTLSLEFAQPVKPDGHAMPSGCVRDNAWSVTCSGIGNGRLPFVLGTPVRDTTRVTARISPVQGFTDPDPGNNTASALGSP